MPPPISTQGMDERSLCPMRLHVFAQPFRCLLYDLICSHMRYVAFHLGKLPKRPFLSVGISTVEGEKPPVAFGDAHLLENTLRLRRMPFMQNLVNVSCFSFSYAVSVMSAVQAHTVSGNYAQPAASPAQGKFRPLPPVPSPRRHASRRP